METPDRYWFRASRATLIALVLASGFLLLAGSVVFIPAISAMDLTISSSVQSMRSDALDQLMIVSTSLGDSRALVGVASIICLVLLISKLWRAAIVLVVGFVCTTLLVTLIKQLVHRARPISDLYPGVEAFSFPSGHMTNATVIYGAVVLLVMLTVRGRARMTLAACISALVALIGVSRVYFGAHWPSDVIGGGLMGGAILCLILRYLPRSEGQLPSVARLSLIAGLAGLIWAVHLGSTFINNTAFYAPRAPVELVPIASGFGSTSGGTVHVQA